MVAVTIASTHCAYPRRDGQAELPWVAGYVVRKLTYPKAGYRRLAIQFFLTDIDRFVVVGGVC